MDQIELTVVPPTDAASRSLKHGRFHERLITLIQLLSQKLSWLPAVGAFLGNVASFILAIIVGGVWSESGLHWWNATCWLLVAAVGSLLLSIACSAILNARRKAEAEERVEEKVNVQEAFTEALVPLLRSVSRFVALPSNLKRERFRQTVGQMSQVKALAFPGNKSVRMVVYRIHKLSDGKARELRVVDHWGQSSNVPKSFRSNAEGRGVKVFNWLDSDTPEFKFVPDREKESDPDWGGTGNGYRTYISIPIVSNGDALGMLTVDAPQPGDLDETDVPMLLVASYALAAAFVVCPD